MNCNTRFFCEASTLLVTESLFWIILKFASYEMALYAPMGAKKANAQQKNAKISYFCANFNLQSLNSKEKIKSCAFALPPLSLANRDIKQYVLPAVRLQIA